MVAAIGSTPPRAARCIPSIQACAASMSTTASDFDLRRFVTGSTHRTRARYRLAPTARISTSEDSARATRPPCLTNGTLSRPYIRFVGFRVKCQRAKGELYLRVCSPRAGLEHLVYLGGGHRTRVQVALREGAPQIA